MSFWLPLKVAWAAARYGVAFVGYLAGQLARQRRDGGTKLLDLGLQRMVEHIADHRHAGLPLAHAAQFADIKLHLIAARGLQAVQERGHRTDCYIVFGGDFPYYFFS